MKRCQKPKTLITHCCVNMKAQITIDDDILRNKKVKTCRNQEKLLCGKLYFFANSHEFNLTTFGLRYGERDFEVNQVASRKYVFVWATCTIHPLLHEKKKNSGALHLIKYDEKERRRVRSLHELPARVLFCYYYLIFKEHAIYGYYLCVFRK